MAEFPLIPRSTYDAVCAERDRLVLREQALIAQVARMARDFGNRATRSERRWHARVSESQRMIASAVATAEAERHARLAADAKLADMERTLAEREAMVPDFTAMPPLVAAALAEAGAGLPTDVQRVMRAKAQRALDAKEDPETVAALIRAGEPVDL